MSKSSGPPPIVFILVLLGLIAGGYWYFFKREPAPIGTSPVEPTDVLSTANPNYPGTTPTANLAAGTVVRIDGSTSMVGINENLKRGFTAQFPSTNVITAAAGTDAGIQALVSGKVDIAAISRPLTPQEQSQGLVATPITTDAIAIVVGKNNPFTGNLTVAQVSDIFQGKINNWSAIGGTAGNLKVINRPAISGTYKSFQEQVLKGANFGTTPNITSLPTDGTTILFQALGNEGIGYATYTQAKSQSTVKVIAIDGLTPDSTAYPYTRQLFYVYKNPANPAVQAFLGYATSQNGQQALAVFN
jgi:phosphate transport system substrate-binding protein